MHNRIRRMIIPVAAALAALTPTAHAGDAATGAAIAGGALIGIGYGVQAATHSKLEVRVDVFDPKGIKGWPDKFVIPTDSAARRAMLTTTHSDSRPVTLGELISIVDAGRPLAARLRTGAQAAANVATMLAPVNDPHTAHVVQELQAESGLSLTAANAFDTFDASVTLATRNSADPSRLAQSRNDLNDLQTALRKLRDQPVSPEYASLFGKLIRGQVQAAIKKADPMAPFMKAVADAAKEGSADRRAGVARVLYQIGAAVREARERKMTVDPAPIESTLSQFGIDLTVSQLETLHSTAEVIAALPDISAVDRIEDAGKRLLVFTYGGFTNGVNLGPIVNEVFQMVHTRPEALGTVTNPKNDHHWHQVALASSAGGTGDHNTIIYLENVATPVVKSSTFDPTKFIVAHGALYKRAFAIAAGAFGMPTGDEKPSDLNLLSVQARREALDKQVADARAEFKKAMTDALDAADGVKTPPNGQTAADAITAAQTKLQAAADRLTALSNSK